MKPQKLTKEQAYEACAEMWNLIAESGYTNKSQALCANYDGNFPVYQCFACEVNKDSCLKCPFWRYTEIGDKYNSHGCIVSTSPYSRWTDTHLDYPILAKQYAIEIAQLFIDTLN